MIVKLLTEYHLAFLSIKGGCTGSSESTFVKLLEISYRGCYDIKTTLKLHSCNALKVHFCGEYVKFCHTHYKCTKHCHGHHYKTLLNMYTTSGLSVSLHGVISLQTQTKSCDKQFSWDHENVILIPILYPYLNLHVFSLQPKNNSTRKWGNTTETTSNTCL